MGFPEKKCKKALKSCDMNIERATDWLFSHMDDPDEDDEEKKTLPAIDKDEMVSLDKISSNQHFTEAPPRYTEASLVKKMEELGIGRPSTYANIISVLQDRGYVKLEKRRFFPEERGRIVTTFLKEFFIVLC